MASGVGESERQPVQRSQSQRSRQSARGLGRRLRSTGVRLARHAGYEITRSDDPRLAPRTPDSAPSLEAALEVVRGHARDASAAARIVDVAIESVISPHHRSVFWGDRLLTLDKTAGFLEEQKFVKAMRAIQGDTGATQYAAPNGIAWRINVLAWAARSALLSAPGDFVECGVYRGDMSWAVTELVDLEEAGRMLFLYDTFEGFSPEYSSEEDFPAAPEFFHRAHQGYSAPGIYEDVKSRFHSKQNVKVIKGVVPDVLLDECPRKVAFLHLDLNSARPETGALEILFDRISAGGLLVFDDYGWILHRRQKDAADDFMRARNHQVLELPTGQGLVVKR